MSGPDPEEVSSTDRLPTFADVLAAARRLSGIARETPLFEDARLNRELGGRVLLKAEPLQHTGSFKFRGAYNALSVLHPRAVAAFSSGNHAQGVARAAWMLEIPCTIVMPADAPTIKKRLTESWGAELLFYDREREDREAIAARIAEQRGATLIRPYDDPLIIAGQGTVGLEMVRQAFDLGIEPDLVLAPCGGGGLIAGCALALRHCFPKVDVCSVEPEGYDDTRRSLESGEPVANAGSPESFCDALLAPRPGRLTFAINRRLLRGGFAVSDAEVAEAMRLLFERFKIVVEPGGAVAMAALLAGRADLGGRCAMVVLSGGNVEPGIYARVLAGES